MAIQVLSHELWFLGCVILRSPAAGLKTCKGSSLGADLQSAVNKLEAERAELDAILASEVLGRSNNLVRLLTYVCDKYFDGAVHAIKEYSIAVQALGRPDGFDPQVDTIVRVTAHALRKRLEDYYRTAGAGHSVHICLPPGHYVPKFIHVAESETGVQSLPAETNHKESAQANGNALLETAALTDHEQHPDDSKTTKKQLVFPFRVFAMTAVIILATGAMSAFFWYRSNRTGNREDHTFPALSSISGQALRATAGDGRARYVDRSGDTWRVTVTA